MPEDLSSIGLCEPTVCAQPAETWLPEELPVRRWRLDGPLESIPTLQGMESFQQSTAPESGLESECSWKRDVGNAPPLHLAAQYDLRNLALALLLSGAEVHETDNQGFTPLHRAAALGREAIAELLLAHRADPNRPDLRERSSLHHAVKSSNMAMVSLLLAYGASSEQPDVEGLTPLQVAEDRFQETLEDLFRLHAETDRFIHNLPSPTLEIELASPDPDE